MNQHRSPSKKLAAVYRRTFIRAAENINKHLGPKPLRLGAGLNVALFDAVFTAFARHDKIPTVVKRRYDKLIADPDFKSLVTATTTEPSSVASGSRWQMLGYSVRSSQ